MKSSLRETTSSFKGTSEKKGIRWEQGKKSYVGYLFMRKEYISLDSMKPHWVNVRKTRSTLLSWAKQAKIPNGPMLQLRGGKPMLFGRKRPAIFRFSSGIMMETDGRPPLI